MKIAALQMVSTPDLDRNLAAAGRLVAQAARTGQAQLAVATGDRDSRAATARSSAVTERAGLTAPAVLALAQAEQAFSQPPDAVVHAAGSIVIAPVTRTSERHWA